MLFSSAKEEPIACSGNSEASINLSFLKSETLVESWNYELDWQVLVERKSRHFWGENDGELVGHYWLCQGLWKSDMCFAWPLLQPSSETCFSGIWIPTEGRFLDIEPFSNHGTIGRKSKMLWIWPTINVGISLKQCFVGFCSRHGGTTLNMMCFFNVWYIIFMIRQNQQ